MRSWIIIIIIVIIDQLTKFYSKLFDFSFGFFRLNYVENTGAAFGILKGYNLLLILISIVVLVIISYYLFVIKNNYAVYGLGFILSGTIGNLIDRIFFGYVRDFIDFGFWPAFNIADSFITIGGIILLYLLIKDEI
ncbi:signal peptidase II [Candidatus Woesearchaeota archaeon]|nr:signal peptidase II [Candidatus Woesearchaeota archaeon]